MHILYQAKDSISEITRKIKGRTARLLLREYLHLKKRYYGVITSYSIHYTKLYDGANPMDLKRGIDKAVAKVVRNNFV